ncbi:MAG: lysophospholipid acyltransferase family protein [Candidatus Omnitrophica bacterium]|nr:lysophospholipid acyltransferase family protein [Candidatus Omnitrophota bacterium]
MSKKKIKRTFRKIFLIFALELLFRGIGMIPRCCGFFISTRVGGLFYRSASQTLSKAENNLKTAFPDLSQTQRVQIIKDMCCHMVHNAFDTLYFLQHPQSSLPITIYGKEHLISALEKKRGVIALTAHFGNFPLLHLALARAGLPFSVFTRPMKDEEVGLFFKKLRDRFDVRTIYSLPRRQAVSETLEALRSNRIVCIQMDQDNGSRGIWVDFFNRPASTPPGPVIFALRTGAPIVPMYIRSHPDHTYTIEIMPFQQLENDGDKSLVIQKNVTRYTGVIETWIRKYPAQWGWIHDRWKTSMAENKDRFLSVSGVS